MREEEGEEAAQEEREAASDKQVIDEAPIIPNEKSHEMKHVNWRFRGLILGMWGCQL